MKQNNGPSQERPESLEVFQEVRKVSGIELSAGLGLLVFGVVPLGVIWSFLRGRTFQLPEFIALTLLGSYVFAVIETFAIIVLWGLGRLVLPKAFVHWLGGATVGEIAVLLSIVVKRLF